MEEVGAAILIAGPTASGKSALALALAERHGGTVVNADSMQVYRDLRILTARPSEQDLARAPHRLDGHVDGAVNYSVARYLDDAAAALAAIERAGRVPVFAGGTGLYFKALVEGLSDVPAVPEAVRAEVRSRWAASSTPALHAELARLDPGGAARLRPTDTLRVLRALEVRLATGRSLLSFRDARRPGPLAGRRLTRLRLAPDLLQLRARIDRRFVRMIEDGALGEVARLGARGLDPALPIMRAHGVPALLAHLRGEISLEEAVARGQADTRAYAKRQFTWARGQMADWTVVDPDGRPVEP
ncbi:MAG: tRNA (adenosine(37)-N6)-dimethylallyltransferase MiaA [Methylobacteriaceae bacterium]|nr:tRNA (adenosine(37)-N6)-dimethylallyltransferase MiaA [Methylobacteriaceae bacterium]